MKIGIEAQRIFRKNKHGMDYVVLQEIRELSRMQTPHEFYVFVKPGDDPCVESTEHVHIIELRCPSYPLWEQWALPRAVHRYGIQLLHCTSNTAPLWSPVPLVLTLHDIIFLEPRDKQNHSIYQNLGWLYRRLVVRPVDDKDEVYKKYISDKGYFFFLGNTDPKKNTERTLVAYAKYLRQSMTKRRLLMADLNKEYLDDIIRRNGIEDIRQHIVMPGYIVNSDLPYVYNNAFAFLYTSLRESFGIPLLEGMACGTPVITSNTSSMPEIGGTEAILVNPESSDDIAQAMLRLETDAAFYEKQRQIGLQRVKLFSWRKTTEQLLKVYQELETELK